jgi:flavodoxin
MNPATRTSSAIMKTALIYSSTNGRTRRVVTEALKHLRVRPEVFNAKEPFDPRRLGDYELFLFFSPTYGDQELQEDMEAFLREFFSPSCSGDGIEEMEAFLRKLTFNLDGKFFAICELGNYSGYDDFTLGAMPIIRSHLTQMSAIELCEPLSLDAFPRIHWGHLLDWLELLNRRINEHAGLQHA